MNTSQIDQLKTAIGWIFAAGFMFVGLIFVVLGGYEFWQGMKTKSWTEAPGRILESEIESKSPNARLRRVVMQAPTPPPAPVGTPAPVAKRRRLDWATALQRTFGVDVWRCPCGGARRIRAVVTHLATAEAMLRSMGLMPPRAVLPLAHAPPQLSLAF